MIKIFIVFITVLLRTNSASMTLVENRQQGETLLNECLAQFVLEILTVKNIVLYEDQWQDDGYGNVMTDLTKTLMQTYKNYLVTRICNVTAECTTQDYILVTRQFIIYANSSKQLEHIIDKCICTERSSASLFAIITSTTTDINNMLQVVKTRRLYRSVLLYKNNTELMFHVGPSRCSNLAPNDSYVYQCPSKGDQLNYRNYRSTQLNKLISMCKLRFGVRILPPYAFEGRYVFMKDSDKSAYLGSELAIIATVLNLPQRIPLDISNTHTLGFYNATTRQGKGLIKELCEQEIDVLLGALTHTSDDAEYRELEYTNPFIYAKLVAVVKKRGNLNFFSMFGVFSWQIWFLLLLLTIVYTCIILLIVNRREAIKSKLSIDTIIFYLFFSLIGKDIPITRKSMKLIFLSWIWVVFFIRLSFEALMVKFLVDKNKSYQIESIDEICVNNFTIFVSPENYWYLSRGFKVSDCFISSSLIKQVDNPLQSLLNDSSDNVATFMYKLNFYVNVEPFIDENSEVPFHEVTQIVNKVPLSFYYRRGDLLGEIFQKSGSIVSQTGLIDYYDDNSIYMISNPIKIIRWLSTIKHRQRNALSLKAEHIRIVFVVYFFGILISSFIFMLEIGIHKFFNNSEHRTPRISYNN